MGMTRSENMRRIRSKDTKPELIVRRLLWNMGYRYRLHREDLPGKPDIVFGGRRKVIFVNGCFWHAHECKEGSRVPKSNREYWIAKRMRNTQKDAEQREALEADGWRVMVVWECEIKNIDVLKNYLLNFLERG